MLQGWPTAGLDVLNLVGEDAYRLREMIPEENRSSLSRFNKKPREAPRRGRGGRPAHCALAPPGAAAYPAGGAVEALARWASGPALDSVLAAAVRFAERTRVAHRMFCAECRSMRESPKSPRTGSTNKSQAQNPDDQTFRISGF